MRVHAEGHMAQQHFDYVIVGAGLAGGSAVDGIREHDQDGSILLIGAERHLPYNRPPLTKELWFGKKQVEDIFLHPPEFYAEKGVVREPEVEVAGINPAAKTVTDRRGTSYEYGKLLLATGGRPRRLTIAGGDLPGIFYYRYLDDYLRLRPLAQPDRRAVVVGGGFIGSEIAAGLAHNRVKVTMVFPEPYLVARIFPEGLGRDLQRRYEEKGITVLHDDVPTAVEAAGEGFRVTTQAGRSLDADLLVVGVGIAPALELAQAAGLATGNGIVVNEYLQTSDPAIYAAGDNALFPYQALGQQTRVEHWDNAIIQGKWAGGNMAGAGRPYDYMPYFYSDLFEFGYEAVGDVTTKLDTVAHWQEENRKGVIYYLRDGAVRGAMMCDVWGQVGTARELIRRQARLSPEELATAIQ